MRFRVVFLLMIAFAVNCFAQEENEHLRLKNDGNAAYRNKDFQNALSIYEAALEAWPPDAIIDAATVYAAADCARRLKDDEKAIIYFTRSLELDYRSDFSSFYLASALRSLNREEEMEAILLVAVEKFQSGEALVQMKKMLATHYLKKGVEHFNRGGEILRTAASAKPEQFEEITSRANVSFLEAKPWFEKVLEIDPGNENAVKSLNDINSRLK